MIIAKKYNLYLLPALLSCADTLAIKLNGKELSSIITPGRAAVCKINDDLALISIKDGNIEVKSRILTKIGNINEKFNNLKNLGGGVRFTSKEINLSAGIDMNNKGYFATAHEQIILQAGNKLSLASSILTAPTVVLACNKMNLTNCYIDADTLQIEVNSPKSFCEIISFKFKKDFPYPHIVEGTVDFENNQTIDDLLVFGVEEVRITFYPKAF